MTLHYPVIPLLGIMLFASAPMIQSVAAADRLSSFANETKQLVAQVQSMPRLEVGSQGSAVEILQAVMTRAEFYNGPITGVFGTQTEAAVRTLQQRYNLAVNGIVDDAVWRALLTPNIGGPASITSYATPATTAQTLLLASGAEGPAVDVLQQVLTLTGFYQGAVTGYFGTQTEAAVRSAQQRYGLPISGTVDVETLNRLTAELPPLQRNAQTPAVRTLQQALQQAGFYNGPITGFYGDQTEAAVRAIQQTNNFSVNGEAGPDVWRTVFQAFVD